MIQDWLLLRPLPVKRPSLVLDTKEHFAPAIPRWNSYEKRLFPCACRVSVNCSRWTVVPQQPCGDCSIFSLRFIGWTIFWSLRCQQNEIFCRSYVLVARIQISWALTTTARIVQMISVPNDLNVWFGWYHVKHSKVSTLFILDHFSEMLCYFIIDASSPWHKYIWHLFPRPYSIVHIVPFETSKKNHFLNR